MWVRGTLWRPRWRRSVMVILVPPNIIPRDTIQLTIWPWFVSCNWWPFSHFPWSRIVYFPSSSTSSSKMWLPKLSVRLTISSKGSTKLKDASGRTKRTIFRKMLNSPHVSKLMTSFTKRWFFQVKLQSNTHATMHLSSSHSTISYHQNFKNSSFLPVWHL